MRAWWLLGLAVMGTACDRQVSFLGSARRVATVELGPDQTRAVVRATAGIDESGRPPRARYAGSSANLDFQVQHYVGCDDCVVDVSIRVPDWDVDQVLQVDPGASTGTSVSIAEVLRECPRRSECAVDMDIELELLDTDEYVDVTVGTTTTLLTYSRRPLPISVTSAIEVIE